MKILTTFTADYLKLFKNIFLPSLPENAELIFQHQNYNLTGCVDFGIHDSLYKMPFILKTLNQLPENEKILYLDVDIVILDKLIFSHLTELEEKDLWIQKDNNSGGVCLGCMMIKNTGQIRELFNQFINTDYGFIKKNFYFSLPYFKHLLETNKINYGLLPDEYYGKQLQRDGIKQPDNIILYHATFESNIQSKYDILKQYFKTKFKKDNEVPNPLDVL
jgi:hypothetical protein